MNIDIKALRKQIRNRMDTEDLLTLLDRVITIIPPDRLPELLEDYFDLDKLILADDAVKLSLLAEVSKFSQESLARV
jgi:flagellar motor switch protein FliG